MRPIIRFTVLVATAAATLFSSTVTRSQPLSPHNRRRELLP